MKYFDTHMHFFPDKLAGKALPKLREISKCETYSDGTRQGTLDNLAAWDCSGGMVLHIATNAHQQTSVNNFAQESQHGNLYCFGSVYPFADNALEEVARVKEMGLYGLKFHPDYQEFMVADEAALPIYAQAERLGLPVAFHTGRDPLSPDLIHCPSDQLAKVADMFPKLTIIAAHMGGMDMPDKAAKYLAGKRNVYFVHGFCLPLSHRFPAGRADSAPRSGPGALCHRLSLEHRPRRAGSAVGRRALPRRLGAGCLSERGGAFRHHRLTFPGETGRIRKTLLNKGDPP